jgi:hypothetical protein
MFIDLSPSSESLLAKAHGRVDAAVAALKVLMCVLYACKPGAVAGSALMSIACITAAAQLYGHLMYLPYYNDKTNHYHVSFAMAYAWACVCGVMALVRDKPTDQVRSSQSLLLPCGHEGDLS